MDTHKFKLEVRERDHGPAQVHLVGGGFNVSIDLATLETMGDWPRGLRDEVLAWVAVHRDELMEEWKRWQP